MKEIKIAMTTLLILPFVCLCLWFAVREDARAEAQGKGGGSLNAWEIRSHEISARLDLKGHRIEATDRISLMPGAGDLQLLLNSSFSVLSVKCDGIAKPFKFTVSKEFDRSIFFPELSGDARKAYANASLLSISVPKKVLTQGKMLALSISYRGEVYDPPKVAEFSRQNIADQTTGVIGEEGVYLSEASHWYPYLPKSVSTYRLETILPAAYEVVSEGDPAGRIVEKDLARILWDVPYPTEALHLIAGKYVITRSSYGTVEISTYFFPEEQELSAQYLLAVKNYLKMYEEMIGRYPFKKFAVVENFFPTGYGMPSFTLLGREVIKLPFIVFTSLGHEVAHTWWGNSVFVDFDKGNWCEGLTTYMADYHYKKLESPQAAIQYRREICRDYTNYVSKSGEDFPLTAFRERTTPATRAVGYGKTLMVFHMLKNLVGAEMFDQTWKEFYVRSIWKTASWEDIRAVFEEKSRLDLGWFFTQWLGRKGAPVLKLENPATTVKSDRYFISFRLSQEQDSYALTVPVGIQTKEGNEFHNVIFPESGGSGSPTFIDVELEAADKPLGISIDPFQDVFRKLHPDEMPPVLSSVLGDKDKLLVIVSDDDRSLAEAYAEIASSLAGTEKTPVRKMEELTNEELAKNSILVFGNILKTERLKKLLSPFSSTVLLSVDSFELNGKSYGKDSSLLFSVRSPWNNEKVVSLFVGFDPLSVKASGRKLAHYGKYSYLAFVSADNKDKGILPVSGSQLIYKFPD